MQLRPTPYVMGYGKIPGHRLPSRPAGKRPGPGRRDPTVPTPTGSNGPDGDDNELDNIHPVRDPVEPGRPELSLLNRSTRDAVAATLNN